MSSFKYREDIDGLRAIAVTFVLLFHCGIGLSGGYIGVDIFFVISGFLITSIVLKQQENEVFSLKQFWVRRIKRIFPAAAVMTILVLFAGAFLLLPKEYAGLGVSAAAQHMMLSNVYFFSNSGYFDGASEQMPLLHTWSLAVEEQFYLLYPPLLQFTNRFKRRTQFAILLAVFFGSLTFSTFEVFHSRQAAFYLLPSRAWELLAGGLLCYIPKMKLPNVLVTFVTVLAFITILFSGIFYDSRLPFPGPTALPPCLATAILIHLHSNHETLFKRFLTWRPLVQTGLLSYSLYLWHWPLLAYLHYHFGAVLPISLKIFAIVASFSLSYVSWRWIENPFRRGNPFGANSRSILATAFVLTFLIIFSGLAIKYSQGLIVRIPASARTFLDRNNVPSTFAISPAQKQRPEYPGIGLQKSDEEIDFVLFGDSHALAVSELVDKLATQSGLSGRIIARPGTVPLLGVWRPTSDAKVETLEWTSDAVDYIKSHHVPHVLLVSRWAVNVEGQPNGSLDTLIADSKSPILSNSTSAERAFRDAIERTVEPLVAAGTKVTVLFQIPLQDYSPTQRLVIAKLLGLAHPNGVSLGQHRLRQHRVNRIFREFESITILDPTSECFDKENLAVIGDHQYSYYADDDHLSPIGAERFLSGIVGDFLEGTVGKKVP